MIPSPKAGLVQLSSLATLDTAKGPAASTASPCSGKWSSPPTSNELFRQRRRGEMSEYVDSLKLPADYRYEFLGRAKMISESNQNFLIAFLIELLVHVHDPRRPVRELRPPDHDPPGPAAHAAVRPVSLILLRTNLNLYAMFGLFMLFGIVKKNGILQVDYTNVLRAKGLPRDEAILEANHTRLRPILMTTVMLIAAMVPIALGRGPGAGARASLAKVIFGGQTLSLL